MKAVIQRLLCSLFFFGWADYVLAEQISEANIRKNRDGSEVALVNENCGGDHPCYQVKLAKRSYKLRDLTNDLERQEVLEAKLIDLDRDGYFDVESRIECGAGPNCDYDIFRYDSESQGFYLFFSGGYAGIEVSNGYIVTQGRSNAATWESQVYKIPSTHDVLEYENVQFLVIAKAGEENNPPQCSFMLPAGQAIKVPDQRWLKYCDHFGENFVLVQSTPLDHP